MEPITPLLTWQNAVQEAQNDAQIRLNEDLESYLVFLLMRFMRRPDMAQSVCGLEFLQAHQAFDHHLAFREVGDKCLLFSGLFPAVALRRRVSVQYYIALGQSAYNTLAQQTSKEGALFGTLAEEFVTLRDVLCCLRKEANEKLKEDLLSTLSLWHENQSQLALAAIEDKLGDPHRIFRGNRHVH
ncbi:MAG: hypothetical protein CMF48_00580 [Legionellales bacterium]|nr:hypothetical protein [Legionellales bacterium]|tara:strand:- start:1536 stop:2090 length:555 start_codon:yes stop_codon:yes gene_type:complete